MFPVIAAIGPVTISSLGLFIALAFVLGGFGVWKKMKEEHYEDEDIFDLVFLSFFAGIIGARFFYGLFNFNQFGFNIKKWLNLAYSNQFSWLGVVLGLMYMINLVSKKKKWSYWEILDYSVLGVIGAQILVDLGLENIRLLTNNPRKIIGLDGYGLKVLERVSLQAKPNPVNITYLKTKKEKLGHQLNIS